MQKFLSPSFGPCIAALLLAACAGTPALPPSAPVHKAPPPAFAQSPAQAAASAQANSLAAEMRSWAAGQGAYLKRTWGVEVVGVHLVSSDWMLEFKYRVLDTEKAAPLLDEHVKPYLLDEASGARLAVPAMENVGELRQHTHPDPDRIYFMLFGNGGKIVPRGGHVTVSIGKFQAAGLPVQ